jgi:hypothetical protein
MRCAGARSGESAVNRGVVLGEAAAVVAAAENRAANPSAVEAAAELATAVVENDQRSDWSAAGVAEVEYAMPVKRVKKRPKHRLRAWEVLGEDRWAHRYSTMT